MKFKREPISKKVRFEVFKRDSFTCQYCGAYPPSVMLHVDHVDPVANGGENDFDNLVTSCEPCNLGKGARLLSVIPESLADKALRVAEFEEQLAGYAAILEAKKSRVEADIWRVVKALIGKNEIQRSHFQSIKTFVEKLGVHVVEEAAEQSSGHCPYSEARAFKYFCGICWNKIRDINQ